MFVVCEGRSLAPAAPDTPDWSQQSLNAGEPRQRNVHVSRPPQTTTTNEAIFEIDQQKKTDQNKGEM
jgi:hypothetical protein